MGDSWCIEPSLPVMDTRNLFSISVLLLSFQASPMDSPLVPNSIGKFWLEFGLTFPAQKKKL